MKLLPEGLPAVAKVSDSTVGGGKSAYIEKNGSGAS